MINRQLENVNHAERLLSNIYDFRRHISPQLSEKMTYVLQQAETALEEYQKQLYKEMMKET